MFYSRGGATSIGQVYVMERLKSSLRKFYGRYGDLIKHYKVSRYIYYITSGHYNFISTDNQSPYLLY